MTTKSRRGSVRSAQDFIRAGVAGGTLSEHGRLVPIRKLASLAGVSLVTMWKAVQTVKTEGLFAGIPRHRVVVAGHDFSNPDNEAGSSTLWQRISADIRHDPWSDMQQAGAKLPSAKLLATRYGVSAPTIGRAKGSG
jgi:DNA-binding GntR family transcriptional regulator